MIQRQPPDIDALCRSGTEIHAAFREAAREAALRRMKLGLPLIVWRDERVTEIPPEEIEDYVDECERARASERARTTEHGHSGAERARRKPVCTAVPRG